MDQVTAALILAAGDSARMGSPKPLLRLGARTFLEVVVAKIREAELPNPVVAISRDVHKMIDTNILRIAAIEVPENLRNQGPIESVRAWLRSEFNRTVNNLLIWPVDQPHVQVSTVRRLMEQSALAMNKPIILPTFGGRRGHPVIFRRAVFEELLSQAADRGAKAVVRRDLGRVLEVPVDDVAVVEDIDTPDDYRALISSTESLL